MNIAQFHHAIAVEKYKHNPARRAFVVEPDGTRIEIFGVAPSAFDRMVRLITSTGFLDVVKEDGVVHTEPKEQSDGLTATGTRC